MNIEIANRLVQLRKANHLSQEALAEKLGISRQAVSKWERAEASPDTDNLILLARLYQVSLDDLLKTDEEIIPRQDEQENAVVVPEVVYQEESNQTEEYQTEENRTETETEPTQDRHVIKWKYRVDFPIGLFAITAYLIIGIMFDLWHPGWLIFLLVPVISSAVTAIRKKRADCFAYPLFMAFLFLFIGFMTDSWHPAWAIFLTIPLYYEVIHFFNSRE